MKYLDYPQFAELSRALTFTSSECTVFTRIEAYSCKPVTQEKPLYKHIQRTYAPEVAARKYGYALSPSGDEGPPGSGAGVDGATSSSLTRGASAGGAAVGAHTGALSTSASSAAAAHIIPPHLADSPFGNLTESSAARKLLFTIIATLNAAFPDHDFADIPVSTFRREPSPAYVVHSLSSTLQSLRRNAAGNNPDAPAAAATSPPSVARSAADASTAFLSAAPRTFAGLPASFDSSPAPFAMGNTSTSRSIGSPSIAATLSPPGQMAQLSLNGPSSFSSAVSPQPPAIALPPALSNAQSSTFPSSGARTSIDASASSSSSNSGAALPRGVISPRLGAAASTSPRIGQQPYSSSANTFGVVSPPTMAISPNPQHGPPPPPPPSAASSLPGGSSVFSPYSSSISAAAAAPMPLPAAITAATHPALASILDDIMCVEECEVYSFHPDIEYDPHASADDDEERLLLEAAGVEGADGGLGLFEDDDGGLVGRSGAYDDDGGSRRRGGIDIGPSNTSGIGGESGRRRSSKGGEGALYGYERDELEDIAEQWGEDDDEYDELEDASRPEKGASASAPQPQQAQSAARADGTATRRRADGDGDEEMADDALLFDEDVYGQGLSGTQTPRAPLSASNTPAAGSVNRPDLVSDTSSSSFFSNEGGAETDGDVSMDNTGGGARATSSKTRVFGPADRSNQGLWGRPPSGIAETAARAARAQRELMDDDEDEDDDEEDIELDDDGAYYSDGSDRYAGGLNSGAGAGAEDDEDDAAGLLWATYAFFYNKRLKRVLFVNVWARTNAGVEAHAAAAAAAARAREREREQRVASILRLSTSPHGGGAGGGSAAAPGGGFASSSWPGQGVVGAGGKASSWSGRISPAQRAISAATRSRASSGSHSGGSHGAAGAGGSGGHGGSGGGGGGGGGFAAKASRASSSPRFKKGDSKPSSSSSSRKTGARR
ncbi:hypothetical protein OC844_002812 [Tilletia horrida]|nr:hypothetical protein OC844_002812 [Tilletia horrida]